MYDVFCSVAYLETTKCNCKIMNFFSIRECGRVLKKYRGENNAKNTFLCVN